MDKPKTSFTKDQCLEYAKRLHAKIEEPKADLLIQQARNKTSKDVPLNVFAHKAQIQLQLHMQKAQDELYAELGGIEYSDFLRKCEEFKLDQTEEYKAIVEKQKENIKAIIVGQSEQNEWTKGTAEKKND